ncbi:MAG: FAD-binding oxidoreductase [Longimonas sp.]|uniref:FAD-binding oxidoreductase n=1 Tax=Longimonas sp. TaxID=2039626 RepID=UPI00335FCB34
MPTSPDPDRYLQLTLTRRESFTEDIAVLHVEAPEPVEFTPGQYATVGLTVDDLPRPLLRPYSVIGTPNDTHLEFYLERVDDGRLTPLLWDLEPGASLWMRRKVVGRFVLDTDVTHHVMAATVTGVGPYVSILRTWLSRSEPERRDDRFLVIHGGSYARELGRYQEELTEYAATHSAIDYVPTVSRPHENPDWVGERGRVEDVLRKHWDAAGFPLDDTALYTCGHPQMIDKAQAIGQRAALPDERIHEEKYFVERRTTA